MATESKPQVRESQNSAPMARVKRTAGLGPRPTSPSIFDQLPPSLYTNPGVIAGCAVFVLLYGLVFFGIMSQAKQRRLEMLALNARNPRRVEPPPWNPTPVTPETTPSGTSPAPKPAAGDQKSAAPNPAPKPEPSTPRQNDPSPSPKSKPPDDPKPPPTPAVAVATKPNIVSPTIPQPPKPAPTQVATTNSFPPLLAWINPQNDSQFQKDARGVIVNVPGSMHLLSPELKALSAPRSLAEVTGDFTIQVTVVGKISPGAAPLSGMPITYQGAGLLLWQDSSNYVRFERAVMNSAEHPMTRMVMIESCKDGMPGSHTDRKVPDRDALALKMERRGDEINCLYTPDGKTWLSLKRFNPTLSKKVAIGIMASNLSPRPLSIRFEDFSLLK